MDYLPVFNSSSLELSFHKIKNLSEHFVYFNDDMFLNAPVKPDYYFKNGLPCDFNKETCFNVPIYTPEDKFSLYPTILTDIGYINNQFNRWETVCQSPRRWFGFHLGFKGLLMSCVLIKQRLFVGFSNYHLEQSFLKSVYVDAWNRIPDILKNSYSRFREDIQPNQYLFRYWQLAQNLFYPMKRKGDYIPLRISELSRIEKALQNEKFCSICLNDIPFNSDEEFEHIKQKLIELLKRKFPNKSSFEITI